MRKVISSVISMEVISLLVASLVVIPTNAVPAIIVICFISSIFAIGCICEDATATFTEIKINTDPRK